MTAPKWPTMPVRDEWLPPVHSRDDALAYLAARDRALVARLRGTALDALAIDGQAQELSREVTELRAALDEHREVLIELLQAVDVAIHAGDWEVDGACDPESILARARLVVDKDRGSGKHG